MSEFLGLAKGMCSDLEMLLNDKEFHRILGYVESNALNSIDARRELMNDLEKFTSHFLQFEVELLRAAGLNEQTISYTSTSAKEVQKSVANNLSAKHIIQGVEGLKMNVCDAKKRLQELVEKGKQREFVLLIIKRSGGLAMLLVDAGVAGGIIIVPVTAPVAALVTSSSMAIGTQILLGP